MGDLMTAAMSGNRLNTLVALRNRLALEIEQTTSGRDLSALSKQMQEVLEAIDNMPDDTGTSAAADVAKRREQRSKASGST